MYKTVLQIARRFFVLLFFDNENVILQESLDYEPNNYQQQFF
jgi:hypothetical protein